MGRIERILSKVDSFNETGRFEEAIKELNKAIDIAPDDPDVLLSFALTYDAMNDLDTSVTYFHKAIEQCPEDAYLWTQYGITLSRNNKHHKAIKIFQHALILDPIYSIAKWNLGL
ncbi:MAG TPA: tetratricopeptide repeat protein, partial [Thermodesulfobacteriota bacterium]|nr:tetratricopeptide repeat protein [Thermodesulfobacteriota bacterium]